MGLDFILKSKRKAKIFLLKLQFAPTSQGMYIPIQVQASNWWITHKRGRRVFDMLIVQQ